MNMGMMIGLMCVYGYDDRVSVHEYEIMIGLLCMSMCMMIGLMWMIMGMMMVV